MPRENIGITSDVDVSCSDSHFDPRGGEERPEVGSLSHQLRLSLRPMRWRGAALISTVEVERVRVDVKGSEWHRLAHSTITLV
jgi:hypothetical protein